MILITLQHDVWYDDHVVDHLHVGRCVEHWDCHDGEHCHDYTCVKTSGECDSDEQCGDERKTCQNYQCRWRCS